MSQNYAIMNMLEIVIGVTAFVGMAGLIYNFAEFIRFTYLDYNLWAFKLMYWLVVLLIGLAISGGVAFLIYCIFDYLLFAGKHIIGLITQPHGY